MDFNGHPVAAASFSVRILSQKIVHWLKCWEIILVSIGTMINDFKKNPFPTVIFLANGQSSSVW